jgi:hypothetical protein
MARCAFVFVTPETCSVARIPAKTFGRDECSIFDNCQKGLDLPSKIKTYSRSWQFIVVLLATLVDLSDRIPSKREVEAHVQKAKYLNLGPGLLKQSYNSKAEPEWKTILAYARRNAIDRGLLKPLVVTDAWEISANGRQRIAQFEQQFRDGKFDLKRLEFLSAAFLERMGVVKKP